MIDSALPYSAGKELKMCLLVKTSLGHIRRCLHLPILPSNIIYIICLPLYFNSLHLYVVT